MTDQSKNTMDMILKMVLGVVGTLLTAAILWVGNNVSGNTRILDVIEVRVSNAEDRLDAGLASRYTSQMAGRDWNQQSDLNSSMINSLERVVDKLDTLTDRVIDVEKDLIQMGHSKD